MFAETFWELNRNLAHWLFELEGELITAGVLVLWHVIWQKGHDRTHHSEDKESK